MLGENHWGESLKCITGKTQHILKHKHNDRRRAKWWSRKTLSSPPPTSTPNFCRTTIDGDPTQKDLIQLKT